MAGTSFRVEVDDAQVRGRLAQLAAAAGDLTPAMDEIGGMLVSSVLHRFETESGPDGEQWKPSERVRKHGGQTLTLSGRLRQSVTHVAGRNFVEVGTNVAYAAIHQFGGEIHQGARHQVLAFNDKGRFASRTSTARRKSGSVSVAIAEVKERAINMPARPFLGIDDGDRDSIVKILSRHLMPENG